MSELGTRNSVLLSQLLEEFARRARDEDPARYVALPVLHPLYDASRLAAFGAISTLGCVHDLLAVSRLGNLCHCLLLNSSWNAADMMWIRFARERAPFSLPSLILSAIAQARRRHGLRRFDALFGLC